MTEESIDSKIARARGALSAAEAIAAGDAPLSKKTRWAMVDRWHAVIKQLLAEKAEQEAEVA